jgi:hypothetical protein
MNTSYAFIAELKEDHARLGQLLATIDDGRWWTRQEPGRVKVQALERQAALIKEATAEIDRVVGRLGT